MIAQEGLRKEITDDEIKLKCCLKNFATTGKEMYAEQARQLRRGLEIKKLARNALELVYRCERLFSKSKDKEVQMLGESIITVLTEGLS